MIQNIMYEYMWITDENIKVMSVSCHLRDLDPLVFCNIPRTSNGQILATKILDGKKEMSEKWKQKFKIGFSPPGILYLNATIFIFKEYLANLIIEIEFQVFPNIKAQFFSLLGNFFLISKSFDKVGGKFSTHFRSP